MKHSSETSHAPERWRLFGRYELADGVYDEMAAAAGALRPHYEMFANSLDSLGRDELAARWEGARRSIRDNGVTYNVYRDPQGMDRPWELDMIPLLLPPAEWAQLETALIQRARLLNLVLADIYGPQRLVREGLLPASLLFANPGFLRACHGIRVPGGIYLHLHGVDMARSANGQWWTLADRTQSPSGTGYALENRIVLRRSLPEAFRDCQVQRLASFFRAQRETLTALAPPGAHHPQVVLLTPGPYNETYFEHAYLARYLGFPLVEGGDLTVRDRRVFIKTLEGLQPVDVILRRLDDSFCDPLELRGDSFLGVAGLVEAARAGAVTIANALGTGAIETPAILAFLPGLCRHLLGEDLRLPSVATWWCGQPKELDYVLDHLGELVVKRAFPRDVREPIFGEALSASEKAALADEIRDRPYDFVAQEKIALSTAPVWIDQRLEPRSLVVRAYATATSDSYMVMPGALTRVANAPQSTIVSMQSGGGSKDTWVLSEGPVSPVTLLPAAGGGVVLERAPTDLPSRVADNLFWLGRYAERSEGLVRLLRSVASRLTDESGSTDTPELSALLQTMTAMDLLPRRFEERVPLAELEQEILAMIFKQRRQGSLRQTLNQLRRFATIVRDRLSIDTWRILNQLHHEVRTPSSRVQLDAALALLNRTIMELAAFSGMEMENMTRGNGWRFLDIGRRLERSLNLMTLVRGALSAAGASDAVLEPLLEIADSSMTYRRRYYAQAQLAPVLDLLLTDDTNPRSLAFQVNALAGHIDHLPRPPLAPVPTREQAAIICLQAKLREADIKEFSETHRGGAAGRLDNLLGELAGELQDLSDTIARYYFSHAGPQVS
ncbi:MAG TPA: circularly permuted type 2 ATP-grasp protein [Verrucomicrobiae bacterium]|nr:circularly permuted type 2 ATP-grasp protein [Verrucomicrobiae bacterium]